MYSHDGKTGPNPRFRWVVELKSDNALLLTDCFFVPKIIYPTDPLLRTVNAARLPKYDKRMGLDFFNVPKGPDVYTVLESLKFDKHYDVSEHLHEGGERIETWQLALCRLTERLIKGQPNDLFTISLTIEYYQVKHFPARN